MATVYQLWLFFFFLFLYLTFDTQALALSFFPSHALSTHDNAKVEEELMVEPGGSL